MKNNNTSGFLSSAKARLIAAILIALVIIGVIIVVFMHFHTLSMEQGSADISSSPNIASIPGETGASTEYVNKQTLQNQEEEKQARIKATSAVPTITRPAFSGDLGVFEPAAAPTANIPVTGACPMKNVMVTLKTNPANCLQKNIELARDSGVTAEELRCQGCSCSALRIAGYTAGDLKTTGLSCDELKQCGFGLQQLMDAGYSAADLKAAGFSANDLKNAGFTAAELKAAGFSDAELAGVGLSVGKSNNPGVACDILKLQKERDAGVSALALRNQGCSLASLKAAGFTAAELRTAGFSAAQLKDAGFTVQQLHDAGFSAGELKAAGFSAQQLHDAGYSADDLKAAGFSAGQLLAVGSSAAQLKDAGFSAKQLHDAGLSAAELKAGGFSADNLKKAGYTQGDLVRAGYVAPVVSTVTAAPAPVLALAAPEGPVLPIPQITPQNRLAALGLAQEQQMNQQQRLQTLQQMQGNMLQQAQRLLTDWNATTSQHVQVAVPPSAVAGSAALLSAEANGKSLADSNTGGAIIKAGSIMFAVLNTSINTDEDTPIMAHVVTGSLKGALILGSFARVDQRVLLKFNVINMPGYLHTFSVNAIAIDPDTARTALSGDVNNHYLLRYGTLFGSAFLQGFATALTTTSSNNNCQGSVICNVTATQSPLNTGQQFMYALGTVGSRYSTVMSNNFSTPPTVKIPGGSGFGLLIMNDLQMPAQ